MSKYVEKHLNINEQIIEKAKLNPIKLIMTWIGGILFCWLLLIPLIKAIVITVRFCSTELVITNKRIVGKIGVFNTKTLDAPLNKIQSASTSNGFWGKIFNYGKVQIRTAAGSYEFDGIKNIEKFKTMVMNQIDVYEEDRIKEQAMQMAAAMKGVNN